MESIGKYLKEQREALGLSIEDVSKDTRMKTYIIEQIERDDFEAIGDVGFLKIMIITYCRSLQADTDKVQAKLVQLFDKPTEPPIKIDTAKNQKTLFIPPSAIYFLLLGLLIVFLTFFIIKLYRDDAFSFNAIRTQLATTNEVRPRTPVMQEELVPDTLWVYQRQLFNDLNNIQTEREITEPIMERIRFFGRRPESSSSSSDNVQTRILSSYIIQNKADYVGEFIFGNQITPLNPYLGEFLFRSQVAPDEPDI